ncbi:MAG: TMEM165/GDT1 family protein [Candidatus Lokiarchaeota archaeon]|nr:TMEM165/GDT1 family protein [Candidatus Lokiarchaeota archaeon]
MSHFILPLEEYDLPRPGARDRMINFLFAFGIAFGLILINELGDKTQIIILCLATKAHYSPKKLALGAAAGFAAVVALGGAIALLLSAFIQMDWITLVSGCAFITLGLVQVVKWLKERPARHDNGLACDEDEARRYERAGSSFFAGFLAIVSMELGDKTQVATILLASTSASFAGTLVGSWAALSSLAVIGALAGQWIAKKVPVHVLEIISSAVFVAIGAIMLVGALGALS